MPILEIAAILLYAQKTMNEDQLRQFIQDRFQHHAQIAKHHLIKLDFACPGRFCRCDAAERLPCGFSKMLQPKGTCCPESA
jgi:hypothetical protein